MKPHWKVGEIAKLTGLTIRTLRFYDQIGLFSPSDQTDSGHRLYTESDISRLHQILSLKELGLALEEIKSLLAQEHCSPIEIVSIQIASLKEKIKIQQKLLEELEHVSTLMQMKEPLTVDDFTKVLVMMKKSHDKYFFERQMKVEQRLDRLGDFLAEQDLDKL
ncbi:MULTISPECIES: MerR family transcriptional regulator [unclassified Paenibacillus]|uniref:MerR family transcriptional regulator n=1 Tax=unclassified Paenibacillus TaxID=185978 RepID=UPI0007093706|nr:MULTISPECIES: MerR family transcriptional regulator [unclassified Paenibacillus]KQX48557.1 MerR family transcriptional regulator [Paenibacillus sp. Root444D2]KRE49836.1 MerR family transcriptional regulator [Paenibacillus sp. Soil724D2]